jgi:hypothetical protein
LLVPNIGVDGIEAGELRAALRRKMQTTLRHQYEQGHRLERDRLAAGVWPGDHNRVGAFWGINIDRYDRSRIQQRMARMQQPDSRPN